METSERPAGMEAPERPPGMEASERPAGMEASERPPRMVVVTIYPLVSTSFLSVSAVINYFTIRATMEKRSPREGRWCIDAYLLLLRPSSFDPPTTTTVPHSLVTPIPAVHFTLPPPARPPSSHFLRLAWGCVTGVAQSGSQCTMLYCNLFSISLTISPSFLLSGSVLALQLCEGGVLLTFGTVRAA
jgi:hypothetical protein